MRAGRPRPARPWGPIPTSVGIVLGWWLVAHSSGQGWVQALGDIVAGGLLVGVLGPCIPLQRVRVEIIESPADATAGRPVDLVVRTSRPVRLSPRSPEGPESGEGPLVLIPARRGVLTAVTMDVATAAPFGIQSWKKRVEVSLPNPLYVSPRRGLAGPLDSLLPDDDGRPGGLARRAGLDGDLRAPRPYRPGDSRRLVHWPASAHTGELMVRELDTPVGPPAELAVTLPADPQQAESAAEKAFGTVLALLERGVPVLLTTEEAAGRRTALVEDRREAARRMAAAR